MLARSSSIVAVCVALALLHGCRRQSDSPSYLTLTHEISPQPPRVAQTTITVTLVDDRGKPVTGAQVILEGNMSHAGMVPVYAETTEIEPGRYRTTMEFSMAGDWQMTAHLNLSNGLTLERQFEIKGVVNQ